MQASRTLESDSGSEDLEMECSFQSFRDRLHGGCSTLPLACTSHETHHFDIATVVDGTMEGMPAISSGSAASDIEDTRLLAPA